jgi:hypothetical protein
MVVATADRSSFCPMIVTTAANRTRAADSGWIPGTLSHRLGDAKPMLQQSDDERRSAQFPACQARQRASHALVPIGPLRSLTVDIGRVFIRFPVTAMPRRGVVMRVLLSFTVCVLTVMAVNGQSVAVSDTPHPIALHPAQEFANQPPQLLPAPQAEQTFQQDAVPFQQEVVPFEHEVVPYAQEVVPFPHEAVPYSQEVMPYESYGVPPALPGGCLACGGAGGCTCGVDLMDVRNFSLLDYRRMFKRGRTPTAAELQGRWRGVNKGLVRLAGMKQFIKEIQPCGSIMLGDNIQVHQVSDDLLRCCGWQPKAAAPPRKLSFNDRFVVKPPNGRGPFGKGVIFSYKAAAKRRLDPSRLVVDKVVVVDCDHLLGRATVRVGLINVPVAYFMLERIH